MGDGEKLKSLMPLLLLLLVIFVFGLNIIVIWNSYSLSRTHSAVKNLTSNDIPHVLKVIDKLDERTSKLETNVTDVQNKINDFEISLNSYLNEMRKEHRDFQQQIREDVRDEIQKTLSSKD